MEVIDHISKCTSSRNQNDLKWFYLPGKDVHHFLVSSRDVYNQHSPSKARWVAAKIYTYKILLKHIYLRTASATKPGYRLGALQPTSTCGINIRSLYRLHFSEVCQEFLFKRVLWSVHFLSVELISYAPREKNWCVETLRSGLKNLAYLPAESMWSWWFRGDALAHLTWRTATPRSGSHSHHGIRWMAGPLFSHLNHPNNCQWQK